MKKIFLALIAMMAVLSARLSDFEVNKIQKAGAEGTLTIHSAALILMSFKRAAIRMTRQDARGSVLQSFRQRREARL